MATYSSQAELVSPRDQKILAAESIRQKRRSEIGTKGETGQGRRHRRRACNAETDDKCRLSMATPFAPSALYSMIPRDRYRKCMFYAQSLPNHTKKTFPTVHFRPSSLPFSYIFLEASLSKITASHQRPSARPTPSQHYSSPSPSSSKNSPHSSCPPRAPPATSDCPPSPL